MGSRNRVRFFPWPYSIFSALFILFLLASDCGAACPPDSDFTTRNQYSRHLSVAHPDRSINEGSYSLSMDLNLPVGDAAISIANGGFTPRATISLGRWQWRLRVRRPTTITAGDLLVSYQITGNDGTTGVLTSDLNPSSHVQATVSTREIRQRQGNNRRRFLGYIDLQLDYSNAQQAGNYSGTITVTVDCP